MDVEASRALASAVARTLAGVVSSPSRSIDTAALTLGAPSPSPASGTLPQVATSGFDDAERADLVVLGVLGEGGMGIVQLAKQRSLGREVAIKRVRHEGDERGIVALLAEAATTGSLEHPNIVPVHALGRDRDGTPLMVMKKIEGVSLRDLIADPDHSYWNGVHRQTFILDTMMRLCDAVAFAHSRGIIHRDIKPENVMIGAYGEVYLLDWGVAIEKGRALPENAIAGTPAYMAPEMLAPHHGLIDEKSDVFLLGATLHEALTGRRPYTGETLVQVLVAATFCEPQVYGDDVPDELASILHQAMSRDRDARFASALELKRALESFRHHRAASALVQVAQARLSELEAATSAEKPEPAAIHELFHECRFAFEQALREWPEHEGAQAGRQRALERMFAWEIAQKNRAGAAALASVLGSPPERMEELAALDRLLAKEDENRRRLERLDYDMDLEVGTRQRTLAIRIIAALLTIGATGLVLAFLFLGFTPKPRTMLIASFVGLSVGGTAAFVKRRAIFVNRINRQLVWTMVATAALVMGQRLVGVVVGQTLQDIAAGDSFVIATAFALSALTVRRLYLVPAALFAGSASLCRFFPETSVLPIMIAAMLAMAILLVSPRALRRPILEVASR